eukprot:TRINITY_DN11865_c0_g1_i1.p1 TRINITY_DN11865_c0_g1~~TRINITY_DN11865_c0_g1_i1.p1  ORF type:complete len:608 (-),score=165.30 TRINITY_DN11865_c0_g1_i1:259-2034(-)
MSVSRQNDWARCSKCSAVFYNGSSSNKGKCPYEGEHKAADDGSNYGIMNREGYSKTQGNWRWCRKCYCLFFYKAKNVCPVDKKEHDCSGSGSYCLNNIGYVDSDHLEGFSWCRNCGMLFYTADKSKSWCPCGSYHDNQGSGNYAVYLHSRPYASSSYSSSYSSASSYSSSYTTSSYSSTPSSTTYTYGSSQPSTYTYSYGSSQPSYSQSSYSTQSSEDRIRAEVEKQMREEADRKAREESEARIRLETEKRIRDETEKRIRDETERKAREEAEARLRVEAEARARAEAEARARIEAEKRIREETEKRLRDEIERKAREEAERKLREDAEMRIRMETEKRLREEEAIRKSREDADRKARDETEARIRLETEKRLREETERQLREAERIRLQSTIHNETDRKLAEAQAATKKLEEEMAKLKISEEKRKKDEEAKALENEIREPGWYSCSKCDCVIYSGNRRTAKNGGNGLCMSGGAHTLGTQYQLVKNKDYATRSGNYFPGWRYCGKCGALFIDVDVKSDGLCGVCPCGGQHDGSQSAIYYLSIKKPDSQHVGDFIFCKKCTCLWHKASANLCPAKGYHDREGAKTYFLMPKF